MNYLPKTQLFINFILDHLYILYPLFAAIIISILISLRATYKKQNKPIAYKKIPDQVISRLDLRAIAGEDMIATQLDLARAYIEVGKAQLANDILSEVIEHGSLDQHKEAQQLLNNLSHVS